MNETVKIEETRPEVKETKKAEKIVPINPKAKPMKAKDEANFTITDKKLVKNIKAYCELNKINYKQFATKIFQEFFNNERTQLELMSKEQLIEVIMQWKKTE